jgi:hypothetical protein
MPRTKGAKNKSKERIVEGEATKKTEVFEEKKEKVEVNRAALDNLITEVETLKARDIENQQKLKMLYDVADKGRVFSYESRISEKQPLRVKLSVYDGKLIVGWRTVKDELVKNPTTGLTVGEVQEYELLLLSKEGETHKQIIHGYVAFSSARYDSRIEAEVVSRKESWDGNMIFELLLPDGRKVDLESRYVN